MIFGILSFDLKDAIDIILVALLLFYLYRLMRASSSSNIFTGVLIFIIVWILVSQVFKMRLLGSILDRLINVGALALIVLFQEEIRHFFSTIGTQRASLILRWFRRHNDDNTMHRKEILPLVMACVSMGKQKVGALIIVERYQDLDDVASYGEVIDARISQRLIDNIFFKNSPLHDGAMVISNKLRVYRAGCVLPVSHDPDIPKTLGLRHRAALGASQKSDCLAIAVSEETGHISVAQGGRLQLDLTAEELESRIVETLPRTLVDDETTDESAPATPSPKPATSDARLPATASFPVAVALFSFIVNVVCFVGNSHRRRPGSLDFGPVHLLVERSELSFDGEHTGFLEIHFHFVRLARRGIVDAAIFPLVVVSVIRHLVDQNDLIGRRVAFRGIGILRIGALRSVGILHVLEPDYLRAVASGMLEHLHLRVATVFHHTIHSYNFVGRRLRRKTQRRTQADEEQQKKKSFH